MVERSEERLGTAPLGRLMLSLALPSLTAQLVNLLYRHILSDLWFILCSFFLCRILFYFPLYTVLCQHSRRHSLHGFFNFFRHWNIFFNTVLSRNLIIFLCFHKSPFCLLH